MPIQRSEHDGENCRYVNTKILHSITWPHYTNSPVLVLFQEFHILENSGKKFNNSPGGIWEPFNFFTFSIMVLKNVVLLVQISVAGIKLSL